MFVYFGVVVLPVIVIVKVLEQGRGQKMRFMLTWEGELKGQSRRGGNAPKKHAIRMHFHRQLETLWGVHPSLKRLATSKFPNYETAVEGMGGVRPGRPEQPYKNLAAEHYTKFGQRWLPLVTPESTLTCHLDILYLRQGQIDHSEGIGDIDGRLKVLSDALCIPTEGSQSENNSEEEQPIYVLLSDDRLISGVTVRTGELLAPTGDSVRKHDAKVVVGVEIAMTIPNWFTLNFAGA